MVHVYIIGADRTLSVWTKLIIDCLTGRNKLLIDFLSGNIRNVIEISHHFSHNSQLNIFKALCKFHIGVVILNRLF